MRAAEPTGDTTLAPPARSDTAFIRSSGYSDLNATQRQGLAALVEFGTHGDGALLLAETGAWYAARDAHEQRPLLGTTWEQVETANQAARAMLKLDGTLRESSVTAAGRELNVGELVTIRDATASLVDAHGVDLPPFAVFGTVERIDHDRGEVIVDFATAGRHTITLDSAAAAALEYGYAEHATRAVAPIDRRAVPEPEPFAIELLP